MIGVVWKTKVVGVLTVAGTLSGGVAVAAPTPAVEWTTCDRPGMPVAEGVECGRLTVPVDWSRPAAGTTKVRVYRWKAEHSKGTVLNFPSGPGEPGDLALGSLRRTFGYDTIAVDPRGVGDIDPMTCDTAKILEIPYVPPAEDGAFEALRRRQKAFWGSCTTGDAVLDRHVDAASSARDADALRRALGIRRLNVYGFSYGTLLAERYLALFGQHVTGSVLQGVMNPAQTRREFVTAAAAGVQAIYDRFVRWCAAEPSCALHGKDVTEVFRAAQNAAASVPGTLHGQPWSAVMVTRYFELIAPGDFGQAARGLLDLSEGRNPLPGGDIGEIPPRIEYADPLVCSDFPLSADSAAQARGDLAATRAAAPVVGFSTNSSNYTSICLAGPRPVRGASAPVTSRSAHPTLLLSNTLDPATPIRWAEQVADQLGRKAVHVRTEKVGHGGGFDDPETLRRTREYLEAANR